VALGKPAFRPVLKERSEDFYEFKLSDYWKIRVAFGDYWFLYADSLRLEWF
jgi:hypothetical protein